MTRIFADHEEHFDACLEYLGDSQAKKVNDRDLSEALYTFSELNIFPDAVDSVSIEQAIMIWQLVEQVRKNGFPEELRM